MRTPLATLGLLALVGLLASTPAFAQRAPATAAPPASTRVVTTDGSVFHGAITGGTVTLRTTFGGDVRIDARRLRALSDSGATLDDGSVVHGTLAAGQVQVATAFGTLTIPADRMKEVQDLRAAAPPPAPPRPDPRETIVGTWEEERETLQFTKDGSGRVTNSSLGVRDLPMRYAFVEDGRLRMEMEVFGNRVVRLHGVEFTPDGAAMVLRDGRGAVRFTRTKPPAAAAKPAETSVQFVNETRRLIKLCVDDDAACRQVRPRESVARTLTVGRHRMKVEALTELGLIVIATGSFERDIEVQREAATIRVTDDDFR